MTVTLELRPELERRLVSGAAARGVSLETYLTSLLEAAMPPLEFDRGTLEEFEADMDALAEGSENLPVLPPEAFTREAIYADRD